MSDLNNNNPFIKSGDEGVKSFGNETIGVNSSDVNSYHSIQPIERVSRQPAQLTESPIKRLDELEKPSQATQAPASPPTEFHHSAQPDHSVNNRKLSELKQNFEDKFSDFRKSLSKRTAILASCIAIVAAGFGVYALVDHNHNLVINKYVEQLAALGFVDMDGEGGVNDLARFVGLV